MHELIGAEVRDRAGSALGRVDAVEANPAHDLLVLDARRAHPDGVRRRARRRRRGQSTCPTACSTCEHRATMRIDVFSLFPEYLAGPLSVSLVGQRAGDRTPRRARARPARVDRRSAPHGRRPAVRRRRGHGPDAASRCSPRSRPSNRRARCSCCRRAAVASTRASRASSRPAAGSRCCAAATKASTSGSPTTCATASCRSATTCSPAARRRRSSSSKR